MALAGLGVLSAGVAHAQVRTTPPEPPPELNLQPPEVQLQKPQVVAHRGSAQNAIENTIPAFQQAIVDGADVLELDIHLTKDRDLAVIHDDTLDRTFGRPGVVREMTSQELREVGVPMFRDVLALPDTRLMVEIKHPKGGRHEGIEQILVDQLENANADARTVVISFDELSLKKVHEIDPELSTGYLYSGKPIDMAKTRDELGIDYLEPHFALVTRDYVKRAHSLGLKVNPWTVNDSWDMRRMIAAGVDGITTDQAAELHGIIAGPRINPDPRAPITQNR